MTKKQAKTASTPSEASQVRQTIQQAKNQSNQLKNQLDLIVNQYEEELQKLEKLEQSLKKQTQDLADKELKFEQEKKTFKDEQDQIIKSFQEEKEGTLKDLVEREERIFNIEKKLASSTTIETKLGKNQVVKLNVGGKVFATNLATLLSVKETFFTGYFNDHFNPTAEEDDNAYFIDRPFDQFHLILNYLRGINIKQKLETLNESDLNDFIEEVVYYQLTPIYEILPGCVKSLLKSKYNVVLDGILDANLQRVEFDKNKCANTIVLESPTRAKLTATDRCTVLGTKSTYFKVKLISNCVYLMIGFAPLSIDVNQTSNYNKCGYYLYCSNGNLYSQNGDSNKNYSNKRISDGSIVECKLENGNISYTINGTSFGTAYSNIPNQDSLYPAFDVGVTGATFELINN